MTYYEFSQYIAGRGEADREQLRLAAIHAAWVMAPHVDKAHRVTAQKLLGEEVDLADCGSRDNFDSKTDNFKSLVETEDF